MVKIYGINVSTGSYDDQVDQETCFYTSEVQRDWDYLIYEEIAKELKDADWRWFKHADLSVFESTTEAEIDYMLNRFPQLHRLFAPYTVVQENGKSYPRIPHNSFVDRDFSMYATVFELY